MEYISLFIKKLNALFLVSWNKILFSNAYCTKESISFFNLINSGINFNGSFVNSLSLYNSSPLSLIYGSNTSDITLRLSGNLLIKVYASLISSSFLFLSINGIPVSISWSLFALSSISALLFIISICCQKVLLIYSFSLSFSLSKYSNDDLIYSGALFDLISFWAFILIKSCVDFLK